MGDVLGMPPHSNNIPRSNNVIQQQEWIMQSLNAIHTKVTSGL